MSKKPIHEIIIENLLVSIYSSNQELGAVVAEEAAGVIRHAIQKKKEATIILATGTSQLTFLTALRQMPDINWPEVNIFHMDEYIGIDPDHPASFSSFLRKHLLDYIGPKAFFPISSRSANIETTCAEYARLLRKFPADLCMLGLGTNGHLAFNDPPFADFDDPVWVKAVRLAEASRRQQVAEGYFPSFTDVPTHAITLTIPALLAIKHALTIVPQERKANAVARALTGPISEDCPGSILRKATHAHLFLDKDSARKAFPNLA